MTPFLETSIVLLIAGCLVTRASTTRSIARLRQKLAEASSEELKTASLRRQLEAHLSVMQSRERELTGDAKKLDGQLSELQAQIEEPDIDSGGQQDSN